MPDKRETPALDCLKLNCSELAAVLSSSDHLAPFVLQHPSANRVRTIHRGKGGWILTSPENRVIAFVKNIITTVSEFYKPMYSVHFMAIQTCFVWSGSPGCSLLFTGNFLYLFRTSKYEEIYLREIFNTEAC